MKTLWQRIALIGFLGTVIVVSIAAGAGSVHHEKCRYEWNAALDNNTEAEKKELTENFTPTHKSSLEFHPRDVLTLLW